MECLKEAELKKKLKHCFIDDVARQKKAKRLMRPASRIHENLHKWKSDYSFFKDFLELNVSIAFLFVSWRFVMTARERNLFSFGIIIQGN